VTSQYDAAAAAEDPIAAQLISQAQTIARLRKDLDDLAHQSTDTFVGLVERIEDIESGAESATSSSTAWCWRDLGPRAAEELSDQLTDWVDWIRSRYPLARKVPACWADHPEILEELTALWLAWQAAYQDRNASLTAASDWHDRWLPGLLYRLEHGPFALDCANGHRPRPATAYAARADTQEEVPCPTSRR